jgi:hypothetical protein
MSEDQALDWAAHEEGVNPTAIELASDDIFCAVCDGVLGDVPEQCPGTPYPEEYPHRWRMLTSSMLTAAEAHAALLGIDEPLGTLIPQGINIYCALCGQEFDARLDRCPERAALSPGGSSLSDDELDRFLQQANGVEASPTYKWREVRWIGHDSWIAIGDGAISRRAYQETLDSLTIVGRVVNATVDGYPFIACFTESDDSIPVEISEGLNGTVEALRVCWTNDVDRLGGTWDTVGRLSIASGRCLVWDPRHHLDVDGHEVEVPVGFFKIQTFNFDGDCLGIRILAEGDSL